MEDLQISRTKFIFLEKEEMSKLGKIVRAPSSFLDRLLFGEISQRYETSDVDVFIAKYKNCIVGWCTASKAVVGFAPNVSNPIDCVELNICISSSYRKMGFATKLLTFIKKSLGDNVYISFPVDEKGRKCYEKNGIIVFNKEKDKVIYSLK